MMSCDGLSYKTVRELGFKLHYGYCSSPGRQGEKKKGGDEDNGNIIMITARA